MIRTGKSFAVENSLECNGRIEIDRQEPSRAGTGSILALSKRGVNMSASCTKNSDTLMIALCFPGWRLGGQNPDAPENSLESERIPLEEFAGFHLA
jgi:hypothetical protein